MTQAKDTPPVSTRPEPQPSGSAAGPAPRGTTDLVAEDPPHTRAVSRAIRRTRRAMVAERILRCFWPLAALLAIVWSALAFGLAEMVALRELAALLALSAAGAGALAWRGLALFRWPHLADARARVDATLPGRPLAGLADRPAANADDPGARLVWAAHRRRLERAAAAARPVAADLRLAARDPLALRLAALVVLISALVFSRGEGAVTAVQGALTGGPASVAAGPSYEGWIEPPDYTGRPAVYLPEVASGAPLSLPVGSRVTLRVYGVPDQFRLSEAVSAQGGTRIDAAESGVGTASFELARDGTVTLERAGRPLAAWSFVAEPDLPPVIALDGAIEAGPAGETRLPFAAQDDHGIAAARVEISLDPGRADRRYGLAVPPEPRPALTADLPLPMTGAGRDVHEIMVEDFSTHPFAGLPVTIRLTATDGRGQIGAAAPIAAVLPGRRFYDPVAAALVEQRRDLLWSTENARRVTAVLRAVTWKADTDFGSARAYLVVRTALRRLGDAVAQGTVADVRDEVAGALWMAALLLEEGGLGDAAQRLAQAKERLQEALRNGAEDQEIARLMDELRQATRDYMEQMAREAIERGESQQAEATPPGQTMSQDQIQQLMDRVQELSEQGRKAEAEALLEMLQQMLENMEMQMTQGQPGQGQEGQGQGQQAMRGLSDTLREQQGLADESFQQLQREFREGQQGGGSNQGQGQGQEGRAPEGSPPGREELARRQEALRQLLEDLREGLPGAGGEGAEQALREAERNMGEASRGLEQGDTSGALDRQSEAIDRLREGMRALGDEMRQAEGQGTPQPGEGEGASPRDTDPLGRPLGARGGIGSGDEMLPGADAGARARQLLDEIRRRSGDMGRPEIELDYLRRLLDQF